MTTWLKKLRLDLMRGYLETINRKMAEIDATEHPTAWRVCLDAREYWRGRIAELEKSL